MKTKLLTAAALITLGLSAQAQADEHDCSTLEGLHAATGYLSFTNNKDLTSLQGKVDEAILKTEGGKTCDATQKLWDYQSKLNRLFEAAKPKVEQVFPDTLSCIDWALNANIDTSCTDDAGKPPRGKGPKDK